MRALCQLTTLLLIAFFFFIIALYAIINMSFNFELDDLVAFVAAAEQKSFRKAAEAIHISQPAFSRRIDKLETSLGVRLIDRNTRNFQLTQVGQNFANKAKSLLDGLDESLLSIDAIAGAKVGQVTIACVPSVVYYYLPRVLKDYRAKFPNIRIRVDDASANDVLKAVESGQADFGLNFVGANEENIDFEKVFEENFVLACRKDHILAKKRSVRWRDIEGYGFIAVSKSSGNRMLLDMALEERGIKPKIIYEAKHVTTLLGMVEADMGIAIVPALAMPNKNHHILASVPLQDLAITRKIGVIKRRGKSLSPAAQRLYEELLKHR